MSRLAVDLFAGSGGVTAGLKAAGWQVLAAVDNDPVASKTYRANHPEVTMIERDICDLATVENLKHAIGGRVIDVLVVCAPCQPFSSQNRKRGNDSREALIVKAVDVVEQIQPHMVFYENVPGLASPANRGILDQLRRRMKEAEYHLSPPLLKDAADFGVPQRRRRCIMVASRQRRVVEAFMSQDLAASRMSVWDAIGDLEELAAGEASATDRLHRARQHSEIALRRLAAIPNDGGSRFSLPAELELICHVGKSGFPDVYGRMAWRDVAPTLTTGCTDVTKGRFAHPTQNRAITAREAARLQTFSDTYLFEGNQTEVARQIGNAVPPRMVARLAAGFEVALTSTSDQLK